MIPLSPGKVSRPKWHEFAANMFRVACIYGLGHLVGVSAFRLKYQVILTRTFLSVKCSHFPININRETYGTVGQNFKFKTKKRLLAYFTFQSLTLNCFKFHGPKASQKLNHTSTFVTKISIELKISSYTKSSVLSNLTSPLSSKSKTNIY